MRLRVTVATIRFESESFKDGDLQRHPTRQGRRAVSVVCSSMGWAMMLARGSTARTSFALPRVSARRCVPEGGTSGYLNWKESGRLHRQAWEDLIVKDISDHVRRHFNVTSGPWGIGGLSMGGYGAMRIGLNIPSGSRRSGRTRRRP